MEHQVSLLISRHRSGSLSKVSRIIFQVFKKKLGWLWEMDVLTITHQQKIRLKLQKNKSASVLRENLKQYSHPFPPSSCLHLSGAKIIGVCLCVWLYVVLGVEPWAVAYWVSTLPTEVCAQPFLLALLPGAAWESTMLSSIKELPSGWQTTVVLLEWLNAEGFSQCSKL